MHTFHSFVRTSTAVTEEWCVGCWKACSILVYTHCSLLPYTFTSCQSLSLPSTIHCTPLIPSWLLHVLHLLNIYLTFNIYLTLLDLCFYTLALLHYLITKSMGQGEFTLDYPCGPFDTHGRQSSNDCSNPHLPSSNLSTLDSSTTCCFDNKIRNYLSDNMMQ